jgi:hypothetical protein
LCGRDAERALPKEDNIFDLVERTAARHGIPRLEMWQQSAKALVEGELPASNLLEKPLATAHPTMTYRDWLVGYRASVDRGNEPTSLTLKHIIVRTSEFEKWFRRWRRGASRLQRGPQPGSTGLAAADRKRFAEISRLIKTGEAGSPYGAALKLARDGKLAGAGTLESKAKRVSRLYRNERASR